MSVLWPAEIPNVFGDCTASLPNQTVYVDIPVENVEKFVGDLKEENANLKAEVERLRAALRPFADAYFQSIHNSETWHGAYDRIDLSYLMAALNQFGGYSGMLASGEQEQPQ